jgi:hypothetical protein
MAHCATPDVGHPISTLRRSPTDRGTILLHAFDVPPRGRFRHYNFLTCPSPSIDRGTGAGRPHSRISGTHLHIEQVADDQGRIPNMRKAPRNLGTNIPLHVVWPELRMASIGARGGQCEIVRNAQTTAHLKNSMNNATFHVNSALFE